MGILTSYLQIGHQVVLFQIQVIERAILQGFQSLGYLVLLALALGQLLLPGALLGDQSTLLLLTSAFAGRDLVLNAYKYAIRNNFMFYSYGDAMLIL